MRNSGEFQMPSQVGQEKIAEEMILVRMQAERANVMYHEAQNRENYTRLKQAINRLHRMTMWKWTGTSEIQPPSFLFEREEEGGEKRMKSFLDDLSADQMQKFLDEIGRLYEKLNLHGYMKERAGDIGVGGKDAAEKAKEKADKQRQ